MEEQDIIIPHYKLNPQALKGWIEEFVTRDGTGNRYIRVSLQQNVAMVMAQLHCRETDILIEKSSCY
jgi:uncharacterized protein YheU (UPF0270 family)